MHDNVVRGGLRLTFSAPPACGKTLNDLIQEGVDGETFPAWTETKVELT